MNSFDESLDRRIKSQGREFSPTFQPSKESLKHSKMYYDNESRKAMEIIQAKYGNKNPKKIVRLVDSSLKIHSTIL